jgi:hypothetical protein
LSDIHAPIAIADPPAVLDVSPGADFETYAIAPVVCALGGFFTLFASALMAVRRRRAVAT